RRVLRDVASAGGYGAVHADAVVNGAMPLTPAVSFRRFHARTVVAAENVGERASAERAGVALINIPGREEHGVDRADCFQVVAKCQARPFFRNGLRAERGIPRQSAETV